MLKRFTAEVIGTFVLVFGGCGSAVFACNFPGAGIGFLGVSLAFGLTVLCCAYALGPVSGCHLNPAVSIGLVAAGRFPAKELPAYIVAQVLGGILAACTLLYLLNGAPGGYDAATSGLAANGFGDHSPGKYSMAAALVAEITLTFIFVMVIVGVTSKNATPMLAGAAIGLALTLVHLIGIPITNLSVNPARSTGPALFVGGWAISQLWLFWIAPIIGGACAGFVGRWLFADDSAA